VARKPADQTVQRGDILLAAAAAFQERGYEGTTMADIARKVSLTAGSLYHHFPAGKQDLLLAVLNDGLEFVLKQIREIISANYSLEETLRRLIEVHVVGVTQNTSVGAAMVFEIRNVLDLTEESPDRDKFLQRRDEFERCYREVIDAGIQTGIFRPVDTAIFTKALLGAHNWVSVWYRPGGRLTGQQIAERMADTFLASLRC
jgi:AcrR family transcriptional regulator